MREGIGGYSLAAAIPVSICPGFGFFTFATGFGPAGANMHRAIFNTTSRCSGLIERRASITFSSADTDFLITFSLDVWLPGISTAPGGPY